MTGTPAARAAARVRAWARRACRWAGGAIGAAALLAAGSVAAADLQIAQLTDNPDPVPAGGIVQYTVRIDNNAPDAARNAFLRFTVPPNAQFVGATPASQNCTLAGNIVECDLGRVGGSATTDERTIIISLRALGPGPDTLAPTATVSADNEVNPGNDSQVANTTVSSGADLALAKTGTPNPVTGGAAITYTLTASNAGPNAAAGLRIVDALSPSVQFVSATGSGWNCAHAGSNPGGTVTCLRPGPHAVGAPIPPVTLVGTALAAGGTVTNSASIEPATIGGSPGIDDPNTDDNVALRDITVLPGADVRIDQKQVVSAQPAAAGDNVTFRIRPRNGGPAAAANAVVTDVLPAGWAFVSASGPGWACGAAGATVTCTRAALAAGNTDDITLVATAPGNAQVGPTGTLYTNTASITSAVADPNTANNAGAADINVLPDGADLSLTKSKTPDPVALGANLTSRIVVTNGGPRAATGALRVIEVLSGETFVAAAGSGWACSASGNQVVCDHPNSGGLAVGAALPELTLTTLATAADANAGNTACSGSSVPAGATATASPPAQGDPNPANDCASASSRSTTVRPDLGITKTTSTPSGGDKTVSAAEASVTYTLVVTNNSPGSDAATGVRITDTLPAIITGRTPAPVVTATPGGSSTATFGCSTTGNRVTCLQSGGALAPGESVTVTVTVQRPLADGSFVNAARVTNDNEGDPIGANNNAQDTVVIAPIADVEMTGKTVTPNPIRAGEIAAYVLSLRNNGPSTAQNVTLTDAFTLPPGDTGATVVLVRSSAPGSSCSIAEGAVLNPGANAFSCSIGTLANGETQTVTLEVRPNWQPGNAARVFGNDAVVATTTPESPTGGNNGNNTRSATLDVSPAQVDLLINKTDAADPVRFDVGNTFVNYRLSVTNRGPSFATGVTIAESMQAPAGKRVRFVCDVGSLGGTSCSTPSLCTAANVTSAPGGTVAFSCNLPAGTAITGAGIGELAVTRTKNVFVRFEFLDAPATNGDVFTNNVVVAGNEPDSFAANNTEAEPTTVRQRLNLGVEKTSSPSAVSLNQPFTWLVAVTNTGPGTAVQTNVTDTLPGGIEVTAPVTYTKSSPAGSGPCVVTGVAVTCTMGQLDAGGVATLSIPARIVAFPAGGVRTNTATVDTGTDVIGGIDTNGADNTALHTITVTRSSLAGTVFQDRERSGADGGTPQAAAAEPRMAGVTVTLTGTDAYGNPVSRSTVTDADGNYRFDDLPPSDGAGYAVAQVQPAGFVNGPVAPPAAGGAAPSAGGTYAPAVNGNGDSRWSGIVLGGAVDAQRYNFPEVARATLAGHVYVDSDASGARSAGDAAIVGATVRLLDAATGSVVATAVTGADGAYAFTGLDPLVLYTLEQPLPTAPAGLANGPVNPGRIDGAACAAGCTAQPGGGTAGADRIAAIDLSRGAAGTAFDFGELPVSGIAGTVFIDRDRDGVLDPAPADGRLGGVTLTLYAGSTCSGTPLATTVTDAAGNYQFAGLPAGAAYTVCQAQPPGFGTGSPDAITIAALPPGGVSGRDFAETVSSLAGSVWADRNDDGVRDAGEAGIAGVVITLTGTDAAGNPVSRTTTTDADGRWRFDDLLAAGPGGYTVVEGVVPPGLADGRDIVGTAGGSAAVNDRFTGIALPAGTDAAGYLFGERPVASIAGTVFVDRDRDGMLDPAPADARLGGVTLALHAGSDCSGTPLATTVTDAAGSYQFAGLPAGGTYTVCQVQPPGWGSGSPDAVTLPALTDAGIAGVDFAERVASLAGAVYLDDDDDGVRDAGEAGIAGVAITLTGADAAGNPVSRTTTTDGDGRWRFDDLLAAGPGGYTVTEPVQPPDTADGRTTAGSVGGAATAPGAAPSAIAGIALGAGIDAVDYLFGEVNTADVVVGKSHSPGRLTVANPAAWRIVVRNAGAVPTAGPYTVTDRLPAGITLAAAPAGSGWVCTGAVGGGRFTCRADAVLAPGAEAPAIEVPVRVAAAALAASPVLNAVMVEGGGESAARAPTPAERAAVDGDAAPLPACTLPATANACRDSADVQAAAGLAGTVWLDIGGADALLDSGDRRLEGWIVEIVDPATGTVVASVRTGPDGAWRVDDLRPGVPLAVRFREPASGIVVGMPVNGEQVPGAPAPCDEAGALANGTASSCVIAAPASQLSVVLAAGQTLAGQSLPVDPSGVVYDSVTRAPVAGATVSIAPEGACPGWNPALHLVNIGLGGFTVSGGTASMVTGPQGLYQYLFTPAAPASCTFRLTVTPPAAYSFVSSNIPPQAGALAPGGAAGSTFEVQPNAQAPTAPAGPGTQYWLALVAGSAVATTVHNHLPLDPVAAAQIALSKTADQRIVEIGDTLRYTLTLRHQAGPALAHASIRDRLPRGFTYIAGTARRNGAPLADPAGAPGPRLVFAGGALGVGEQLVITYRVRVGVGSAQGDGTNRAQAFACGVVPCVGPDGAPLPGALPSNEGAHRVQVTGGVFGDEACVLGKVFVDCNGNHVQDREELGIPGVRLYLQDGSFMISDSEGKYSLCGLPPRSHVLKPDPSTLPRGSRLVTSSNRNLGDGNSLWLDLKNGELHRADVIEGSCSNTVLEQVKARRAQGEVRSIDNERPGGPALRFDSKPGVPAQGTDSANQPVVRPRAPAGGSDAR